MMDKKFIRKIQAAITDEIFFALGLNRRGVLRRFLGWLFTPATRPFARYIARSDEAVAQDGAPAGGKTILDILGVKPIVLGRDHIPLAGPVIILSNHPGAYDGMSIISLLPRKDLKVIVSKTRFYQALPHIYPHLIPVGEDSSERMVALKDAVDHLRQGGILLQFGSGLIEPDPAHHRIEDSVFEKWSPSLEILLRKVPETQIVPTIASNVLQEKFERHPLTQLRKDEMDKRRLAEFMQVIQQLVFPKSVQASPKISFGEPFTLDDIVQQSTGRRVMSLVIQKVKKQLSGHLNWMVESTNLR